MWAMSKKNGYTRHKTLTENWKGKENKRGKGTTNHALDTLLTYLLDWN